MATSWIPKGFHHVTPYLAVHGAAQTLDFVKRAFGGQEVLRMADPEGGLMHAEVKIGDSIVMIGEARGGRPAMPTSLYVYVENVDAVYKQALQAGGASTAEPADQFYGDRMGSVKDPAGNQWMVATHQEDVSAEEMRRRAEASMRQRKAA